MNEFSIINKIIKRKSSSEISIGDDCSLIPYNENQYLATTSDMLVEDIHFRRSTTSYKDLGYKTLAVSISDIAAMAAKPCWAHLSLAIPKEMTDMEIKEYFDGFYELADQYQIQLMGGDLSASKGEIFISLTLSGVVDRDKVKKRSDFKPGDRLYVTGALGDSAAGLKLLELGDGGDPYLISQHLRPKISVERGQQLGCSSSVNGMMDLSDGLLSDLQRAAEFSNCGFDIELGALPLSKPLQEVCKKMTWDPFELALAGGEDYCLLFSAEKNFSLEETFSIGKVTERGVRCLREGVEVQVPWSPFSHF